MSKRNAELYIQDILDAITDIEDFTRGMANNQFVVDKKTVNAVIKSLEIIGEAVNCLPGELLRAYPEVSWKEHIGMRNKITHAYFGVSLQIVWDTIKEDLPVLKQAVEKIKSELV
ncbi:MAG: DUF86 domain-containing protein [Patescibacteria group bacterium]